MGFTVEFKCGFGFDLEVRGPQLVQYNRIVQEIVGNPPFQLTH